MPFDFNLYSALLLPAFVQGMLFTAILLLRSIREDRPADRLLAFLLLIFTLRVSSWMLGFAGWYDSHDAYSTFMFYFPFNHWLAIGPLVYFYFRSLTNSAFRFRPADRWHFAPAFLRIGMYLGVVFIDVVWKHGIQGQPFPDHWGTKGALADWPFGWGDVVLSVVQYASMLFYFVLTWRAYRRYRQYLNANFSETGSLRFTWLKYFLFAVGSAMVVWVAFKIAALINGRDLPYVLDWYSFFAWGIIIYYLSIAGYGALPRQVLALHFEPEAALPDDAPGDHSTAEDLSNRLPVLLKHMESERPYLQPELTLSDLAAQLQVSPALLSRIINTGRGKNFNEFINEYRVEAVKRMVLDPAFAHLSILGMAYECGFNSKATFNRAFQKHAGCSPSDFVKAQKKNSVSKP